MWTSPDLDCLTCGLICFREVPTRSSSHSNEAHFGWNPPTTGGSFTLNLCKSVKLVNIIIPEFDVPSASHRHLHAANSWGHSAGGLRRERNIYQR